MSPSIKEYLCSSGIETIKLDQLNFFGWLVDDTFPTVPANPYHNIWAFRKYARQIFVKDITIGSIR